MIIPESCGPVLKTKDKVLEVFKHFVAEVERETGHKLKCIRSDNGGEYRGPFETFCKGNGIKVERTIPKTPQQNGVAERMNRTICERIQCMLSHSKLSKAFWGEALNTAVHLINLLPSHALDGDVPSGFGPTKMCFMDTCRYLVVEHLCTFLEMKGLSLIARQRSVFSWVTKPVSLVIDCGIRLRRSWLEVEM
jgi:hypothetical protein